MLNALIVLVNKLVDHSQCQSIVVLLVSWKSVHGPDPTDLSQLGRIYEYYHNGRRIFTHGLVEEHANGTGAMPGGRRIVVLS